MLRQAPQRSSAARARSPPMGVALIGLVTESCVIYHYVRGVRVRAATFSGSTMSSVGKEWKDLSQEDRARYMDKASLQKAVIVRHLQVPVKTFAACIQEGHFWRWYRPAQAAPREWVGRN